VEALTMVISTEQNVPTVAGNSNRRLYLEAAFWALAVAAIFLLPRKMLILNEIAILGLFALSLDLILGYAGILSLGHAAFLGLGAYGAGLFAKHVSGDPLLGLAVAAGITAVAGFLASFLVLRGADLTRLMVTLGLAMLLGEVANKASHITGGADGLQGIEMKPILGLFTFGLSGRTAYVYSLTTLFLAFLVARRLVASKFGMSLQAIRDNPLRAGAIGIPVNRRLVTVYTISAVFAGIAGALLAQTTQFVSLDVVEMHRSADVLLMLVIGGTGYLYGGLIGAVAFKLMQEVLSDLTPQYWQFWIGLLLVILVLVGRDRVAGMFAKAFSSLFRSGKPKPEAVV
jgi:branched-chain amino acid transport system permease protein